MANTNRRYYVDEPGRPPSSEVSLDANGVLIVEGAQSCVVQAPAGVLVEISYSAPGTPAGSAAWATWSGGIGVVPGANMIRLTAGASPAVVNVARWGSAFAGDAAAAPVPQQDAVRYSQGQFFGAAGMLRLGKDAGALLKGQAWTVYPTSFTTSSASWSTTGMANVTAYAGATATGYALGSTPIARHKRPRVASAASLGAVTGYRVGSSTNGMNLGLPNGFRMGWYFGPDDTAAVSGPRSLYGLTTSTGDLANAETSGRTNIIAVGSDAADANLSMMVNDGSGAATKVDLGADFPANTTAGTNLYYAEIASKDGTSLEWMVENMLTGATRSGVFTSDLPSVSTNLFLHAFRTNNADTLAVALVFGGAFMTPY